MSLLEIYKNKNNDKDWFEDHFSLGKGKAGRMFEYTNTNFRKQDSFIGHFLKFQEIENLPRESWPKQASHGQEIHKHMVINMIQSKLYKKNKEGLFSKTNKGTLYSNFITAEMPEEEKWLVNYLFLLNGYFLSQKNYIIYRVKENLLGQLLSADGLNEELIINSAKELLNTETIGQLFRSPFFYIHSFYNDSDFLINYFRSTEEEKEELAQYIENNLQNKTFQCCISSKYRLGGNFNKEMIQDETKVFLLTLLFVRLKNVNLSNIYNIFVNTFNSSIAVINTRNVLTYLNANTSVFEPIFYDVLEVEEVDSELAEENASEFEEIELSDEDTPEDYIDETSEEGKQQIRTVFSLRKKQARIQSNHKCCLEVINNCRPIYFTSKANGQNYLELHHLIPREFRNDFPQSIEVLANYITLCPRCHRQIHLAMDRERKHLINSLYEERKGRLNTVGLNLDLPKIYEYYKIDA